MDDVVPAEAAVEAAAPSMSLGRNETPVAFEAPVVQPVERDDSSFPPVDLDSRFFEGTATANEQDPSHEIARPRPAHGPQARTGGGAPPCAVPEVREDRGRRGVGALSGRSREGRRLAQPRRADRAPAAVASAAAQIAPTPPGSPAVDTSGAAGDGCGRLPSRPLPATRRPPSRRRLRWQPIPRRPRLPRPRPTSPARAGRERSE